jgi:hypothetical protein
VSRSSILRHAAACSLAGLTPAIVLFPVALRLVAEVDAPRRTALALLLVQTVYLLGAGVTLGLSRPSRGRNSWIAVGVLLPVSLALIAGLALGADRITLLLAQPAALAWGLLAWGCGRAARDAIRRAGTATAVALLALVSLCAGVLPISHLSFAWAESPAVGEALLATNPFVVVCSAAGFDLLRGPALYDALAISGHRFHYPGPFLPPLLIAATGLALGLLRIRPRVRATVHLRSSREELSV